MAFKVRVESPNSLNITSVNKEIFINLIYNSAIHDKINLLKD